MFQSIHYLELVTFYNIFMERMILPFLCRDLLDLLLNLKHQVFETFFYHTIIQLMFLKFVTFYLKEI